MTRQTTEALRKLDVQATNRSAREIARMVTDGWIDLNPSYQRGEVWTLDQQIGLIRSFATGVPIPALIINNRARPSWDDPSVPDPYRGTAYACIDGQQRIRTMMAWFDGELAVPASWFDADDIDDYVTTDDGPYVTYDSLAKPVQRHIAFTWTIPFAEASLNNVRAEAEVFLLVNGEGTPQTDADMNNARRVAEGG